MLENEKPEVLHESNAPGADTQHITRAILNYKKEAELARRMRDERNKENMQVFNLDDSLAPKMKGQSNEFLPKQNRAAEQLTQFIQQTLTDIGEWFSVSKYPFANKPILSEEQVRDIILFYMKRMSDVPENNNADGYVLIGDMFKSAILQSLFIARVDGTYITRNYYEIEKQEPGENARIETPGKKSRIKRKRRKFWRLNWQHPHPEDFFPDPTGRGLYVLHRTYMDLHTLQEIAAANPEIYDRDEVAQVRGVNGSSKPEHFQRERERGQNETNSEYRNQVEVIELFGTLIDEQGVVIRKDCYAAIADDTYLIAKPQAVPGWAGLNPLVWAPFVRTPHSVWHQALMDSTTKLNKAANELFNFTVDAGIRSVFGIQQVRSDLLANPDDISNGIAPQAVLELRAGVPAGQQAIEQIKTGQVPFDATSVYNLLQDELNQTAITNDPRMGGLPGRSVTATEIVEASSSINSILSGIAKSLETALRALLSKSYVKICENIGEDELDELQPIIGEEVVNQLKAMSDEERFAALAGDYDFEIFGLSETLKQLADFRKLITLLQTIGSNEILIEAFQEKYDFRRLLGQLIRALGVREDRIKLDLQDEILTNIGRLQGEAQGASAAPLAIQPDLMSQIPQAGSASDTSMEGPQQLIQGEKGGVT